VLLLVVLLVRAPAGQGLEHTALDCALDVELVECEQVIVAVCGIHIHKHGCCAGGAAADGGAACQQTLRQQGGLRAGGKEENACSKEAGRRA
jgi:hypothetical protein